MHLEASGSRLEPSRGRLGGILGPLGGILGTSWAISGALVPLGAFGGCLGASLGLLGGLLGHSGDLLGRLGWGPLGGLFGRLGTILGASWAVLDAAKTKKANMLNMYVFLKGLGRFLLLGAFLEVLLEPRQKPELRVPRQVPVRAVRPSVHLGSGASP